MVLRGDLKSLNLANVLQNLANDGKTGTLSLHVADRRRFLWFEKGQLRLVGVGGSHGPSILNGLLATGRLKASELAAPGKQGAGAHLRALQKKGQVTDEHIRAALQEQMIELVCDAFLWTDAEFEFVEGEPDEDMFDVRQLDWEMRLACDGIIMEALRRVDEWSEIKKLVSSPEEIFEPVAPPPPEGDAVTQRVWSTIDGERRIRDVLQLTHLGQFAVFKCAALLMKSGSIRPLSVEDARKKAMELSERGEWEQALRLSRCALEHERLSVELRRIAATALEGLGRAEEAATEYRILLSQLAEEGKREMAVETCRKIIALAPRDTFTQEKLFDLLLDLGQPKEALLQGEALASSLKRAGMPDRARGVYERLVAKFSDNEDIIESLAEIVRQMGDKEEAIVLYRKLFDRALARGDEELVVRRSRTLLRLDPSLEDVAKRRFEVETGIYRKQRVRKERAKWIAIAAVVGLVILLLGANELRARSVVRDARAQTLSLVEKRDYAGAVRLYASVLRKVAWTFVESEARKERDDLEQRFSEYEFPRAEELDKIERIPEAIAMVDGVADLVQKPEVRARAAELRAKFREHRGRVENAYLENALTQAAKARKGEEQALVRLLEINHPLAVPAMRALMDDESTAVRRAAILVLGKIRSDEALELLVKSMAADPGDTELRKQTELQLREASGQDLGPRAQEWEAWLLRRGKRPVQALIHVPKTTYASGERVTIEWRIANLGGEVIEFGLPPEFGPVFKVADNLGTVLKPPAVAKPGEDRAVRLRAGEFVGGTVVLKELAEGADLPGVYRVSWAARVKWGGNLTDLGALPVTIEILAKK